MRNYLFFTVPSECCEVAGTCGPTCEALSEQDAAELVRAHDTARDHRTEGLWKALQRSGVYYLNTYMTDENGTPMAVRAEEREEFVKAANDRPVWEIKLRMKES